MAALNELHVYGEEFEQKSGWRTDLITRPANITIGLFDSTALTVSDTTDIADITGAGAEPTSGNYARQSAALDSSDIDIYENGNGDWEVDIADQVFDTTDTTKTVDAYFVLASFNSTSAGDSSANDHVMWTGDLSQSRDLSQIDELTLDNAAMNLD